MARTAEESGPSLGKRALAILILLVAGWLLLKFVIGVITAVAWTVVAVVAVLALVWALRVIL